jgi:hypothetical protein
MKNLEGPDVSLEISLKEYGIAWEIGETETRFYYGIALYNGEYTDFDWADLANNTDVYSEYDWVDFKGILEFTGLSYEEWENLPLFYKIQDLVSFHGTENQVRGWVYHAFYGCRKAGDFTGPV